MIKNNWKEESIKTRIETNPFFSFSGYGVSIEKKNPLKQGLKLETITNKILEDLIEKKNPLKQGLKPRMEHISIMQLQIEKKNPLKQGLKQI